MATQHVHPEPLANYSIEMMRTTPATDMPLQGSNPRPLTPHDTAEGLLGHPLHSINVPSNITLPPGSVRLPLQTQQQAEHPLHSIQRFFGLAAGQMPGDPVASSNFMANLPALTTPQHSMARPFSQQGAQLFNNHELTPQSMPQSQTQSNQVDYPEHHEREIEVSSGAHATVTLADILDEMSDDRRSTEDWEADAKDDIHDKFELDMDVAHETVLALRDAFCAVNSELLDTTRVLAEKKRMLAKVNRHLNKIDELQVIGEDDEAAQECFEAAHASLDALREASSSKVDTVRRDALALKKQIYVLQRCLQETHDMSPRPQCPICMEQASSRVCIPCGHTLCSLCASQLENDSSRHIQCYTCRGGVSSVHKVYF